MEIGDRIRAIRMERGLTQKELGNLCGMADSAIRRYESNRGNPTQKTLIKIAKALGVHLRDLSDNSWLKEIDQELGPEKLAALRAEVSSSETDEHKPTELEQEIIDMFLKLDDPARSALLGYANRLVEEMRDKPSEEIPMDIESQLERYRHGLLMGIATAQVNFTVPPEDIDIDSVSLTPELTAMVEDAVKKQRKILEAEQQQKK
ncbi:helix-turn-helix domain-containing protein [Anaerotruncus colihominis]|uniref:helix-turn-helix domain-containing protein n=1 Tax=Anaerotruncus colihominis TaxID=169435 RepID=UPI00267141C9|nr:helix-turn-helix domain-containing protein [Anaerotruncus colihominis]